MKKSELRKIIRQSIKEQLGPGKHPSKGPGHNPNQIGPATPLLGYDCLTSMMSPLGPIYSCTPVYDIPMNAGVTPSFGSFAECHEGCYGGPHDPPDGQGMPPSPSRRRQLNRHR